MTAMEKNNKTLNVPHLRFPEFSGEWVNKRMTDIAPLQRGFDLPTQEVEEGEYPVVYSNGILRYHKTYKCEAPGLVTGRSGSIGSFTFIGEGKYWPHNTSLWVTDFNKNHPLFIYYLYQTINISQYASGSSVPTLNRNDVHRHSTNIPSLNEQIKIAALLEKIDKRIDTQKKIIEDLKKLKDAICNLNFTSGSSLTLGDIGYFVRGLTYSASDVIDDTAGTAVMRSNNISNGDPVNFDELIWVNKTPNHDQILRAGDMVICMANGSSALVGKSSYYINSEIELATVGAFCGIYRSDNPLTKWLFQSTHYKKHLQRSIQGGNGAIANIYPEDILAISFNIPADHERILNILNSLEEKYLLEYKLLCGYLGVKSHLLSQLFI